RSRPQSLRLLDVVGRRRHARRLRPRRHRRIRLRRGRESRPRPRPARHALALAGLRPHEANLPLRRPRLPTDRRAWPRGEGVAGVKDEGESTTKTRRARRTTRETGSYVVALLRVPPRPRWFTNTN